MSDREIRKISDAEIVSGAKAYFEALPISNPDSIKKLVLSATASIDTLFDSNKLSETERSLFEAYAYQLESKQALLNHAEKKERQVFFFHPFFGKDSTLQVLKVTIAVQEIVKSL